MEYTIKQVSELVNLSKASIYNKLKSNEFQKHMTKKQGVTYLDEIGLKLIQGSLKDFEEGNIKGFKEDIEDLNIKETNSTSDDEVATDTEDSIINKDYINYLKSENENLWNELQEKNLQLKEFNNRLAMEQELNKNNQILLKDKPQDIKLLEQHFQDLDDKIMNIKERNIPQQKGFFKKWFKK